MTQADLNRAVAEATGETISEIKHRGFQPLDLEPAEDDLEAMFIDWDELELRRNVAVVEQRLPRAVA
ncbi:MAG: hypothetical protein KF777_24785 [Planctomycetaceae bacterium]|nr:hypothetical protein [Planctomycetaceae bacterium]